MLCQEVGIEVRYKEELIFPRILLCKDYEIKHLNLVAYYHTFFHELGYHFAHKELGKDGYGEDLADKYSARLFKENIPTYFLLTSFRWWFEKNYYELTTKQIIFATINFFMVICKERKLNLLKK